MPETYCLNLDYKDFIIYLILLSYYLPFSPFTSHLSPFTSHYLSPSAFYLLPPNYINQIRHIPDISMQAKASGVNTFQHKFINWSTRKRGNVQRIHICTPTSVSDFSAIQKIPQAVPVVHVARCNGPILGNGVFHAPKNRITPIIDTRNIIEYSARNIKPKRSPEYSVWKPDTSSDSASGISKGARLLSANEAIK